jgi:hypothetical protein
MKKIKVNELAREFNLTCSVLLKKLNDLGIKDVKTHMTSLKDEYVERVLFSLMGENSPSVEEIKYRLRYRNALKWINIDNVIDLKNKNFSQKEKNCINKYNLPPPEELLIDLVGELDCEGKINFNKTKDPGFSNLATSQNLPVAEEKEIKSDEFHYESNENDHDQTTIDPISSRNFIIDASNVCRSYFQENNKFSLKIVLSIVCEILKRSGTFICIFDANINHIIEKYRSDEIGIFQKLKNNWPNKFCTSTGRMQADNLILSIANNNDDLIISNDNYREFESKYKWIVSSPNRLIKGRIIDETICIPDLDVNISISKKAGNVISYLKENLD